MAKYYAAIDGGRLHDAVAMLADDVQFAMVLPGGERRGGSQSDMLEYLSSRPQVNRKHWLLRVAADEDMEFGCGAVADNDHTTGFFVSAMHIDPNGRIDRYQVTFIPDFAVLPTSSPVDKVR